MAQSRRAESQPGCPLPRVTGTSPRAFRVYEYLKLPINFKKAIAFGEEFLDSGRHSQSADARKLQRGPANVESQHRAQEVDFQAFDPSDGET